MIIFSNILVTKYYSMYINQNNLYYGCYYPIEIAPAIMDILRQSKYSIIETGELNIGIYTIFANVNSDIDTQIKFGFIVVDEMTVSSNDFICPYGAALPIKLQDLLDRESNSSIAIEHISAIHRLLIAGIFERGISMQKIYRGWFTMLCTFEQ